MHNGPTNPWSKSNSPSLHRNQGVSPHMAGTGWENVERRIATVWQNIDAVLRGDIPSGVVTTTKRAANMPVG